MSVIRDFGLLDELPAMAALMIPICPEPSGFEAPFSHPCHEKASVGASLPETLFFARPLGHLLGKKLILHSTPALSVVLGLRSN
jgi:hypothetical protein